MGGAFEAEKAAEADWYRGGPRGRWGDCGHSGVTVKQEVGGSQKRLRQRRWERMAMSAGRALGCRNVEEAEPPSGI